MANIDGAPRRVIMQDDEERGGIARSQQEGRTLLLLTHIAFSKPDVEVFCSSRAAFFNFDRVRLCLGGVIRPYGREHRETWSFLSPPHHSPN